MKSICAFLNSEGGLIIWGAPEGKKVNEKKEKIFQGDLTTISKSFEKDSLLNKIHSAITPLPNGINVQIIPYKDGTICIFEVQKSNYSPHQWANQYWMRIDGQSKIAPHHYIEALFKQIHYPNLEGYIKFLKYDLNNQNIRSIYSLLIEVFLFNFSPLQNENNPLYTILCNPGKFAQITFEGSRLDFDNHQLIREVIRPVLHYGSPIMERYSIIIPADELYKNNYEVDLIYSFGGEFSPLKTSKYKLNLLKPNQDLNANIISMEENILMVDSTKILGLSKEKQLKDLIGR